MSERLNHRRGGCSYRSHTELCRPGIDGPSAATIPKKVEIPLGDCVSFGVLKKYYDQYAVGTKTCEYRGRSEHWESVLMPSWIPNQRRPPRFACIYCGDVGPALYYRIAGIFHCHISAIELPGEEKRELFGEPLPEDCIEIQMAERVYPHTKATQLTDDFSISCEPVAHPRGVVPISDIMSGAVNFYEIREAMPDEVPAHKRVCAICALPKELTHVKISGGQKYFICEDCASTYIKNAEAMLRGEEVA